MHKGRIDRNLPGPVAVGAELANHRAGEFHTPLLQAEHDAHAWLAADTQRLYRDEYRTFWDGLAAERDAAYEQWWSGFARLERTQWVVAA